MKYRSEIDGLRAVAVLPVILFHAGFSVFSGGYVGVDVFFVISGYLITSILIAEIEQGKFSILRFYERRARRILPALFTVMLACLPFAYLWMLPSQLKDFAQSIVAVIFFSSNILFWREDGYFAAAAELKPLLHTWSLAVEEQYYLLFPLFLLLVWRFGRNRVFWSVVAASVASLLVAEWGWRNSPSGNFYLAPSRAWEMLAGSICAFLTVGRSLRSSNVLSATGLSLIVFSVFYYDSSTPFPSVYALAPVVGTALIILFAARETLVARLLSTAPFVGIGLISYSAYLWHQPLFSFARLRSVAKPDDLLMAALAVLSLVLAWLTWRFIEQPFRKKQKPLLPTRTGIFVASGVVSAAFAIIGFSGHFGQGFDWRSVGAVSFRNLDERVAVNHGLHSDCEGRFNDSENCFTSKKPNVLLWGDSFAMHLAQGIVASDPNLKLQQHTISSCSPILGLAQVGGDKTNDWAEGCISFNDSVLNWLSKNKEVNLVILSSPFSGVLGGMLKSRNGEIISGDSIGYVADKLRETVDQIHLKSDARVLIVSPTPRPENNFNLGQCAVRSVIFGASKDTCSFKINLDNRPYQLLQNVSNTIPVYWLQNNICDDGLCNSVIDDTFIYRDTDHLSKEGSAYLGSKNKWIDSFYSMAF
jgi:peptidoglycan/LPS O-acetylase OafA/YrhL